MGFKRKDVQKCLLCNEGIAHNQFNPTFYRVRLERFILDFPAIRREGGFEASMGGGQFGAVMAGVMGTDPDLATSPGKPIPSFLICGDCAGFGADENDPDQRTYTIESLADREYEREHPDNDAAEGQAQSP